MFQRRAAKHSKSIMIMVTTVVLCLGVIGTNYANWSNDFGFQTMLLTGDMEPVFRNTSGIDDVRGEGKLRVKQVGRDQIEIRGIVETGYKANLEYGILNSGSIPFEYLGDVTNTESGIKLKLKQKDIRFEPGKGEKGKSMLQISADEPGNHEFEIELLFRQCQD